MRKLVQLLSLIDHFSPVSVDHDLLEPKTLHMILFIMRQHHFLDYLRLYNDRHLSRIADNLFAEPSF
jgi:hypothetical protein